MNIIFNIFNDILRYLFDLTGDWGMAIVLLTVIVKLILMPFSLKQKSSLKKQQELSLKVEELKKTFKNNKKKLEMELQKHYDSNKKHMFGCMITFIQLPIIMTLYNVVLKLPIEASTSIIPWVTSLKLADNYHIIPLVYSSLMCMPNLISYLKVIKNSTIQPISKSNVIVTIVISILFTIKTPIAIGIYLITSAAFAVIENIIYSIFFKENLA
ncbi:membrane protein insertase, YidC/Oxa1 family, C-terminal domain-containing protein [Clostridium cavendishii DSM 21758]|uniref:Membrane protein insertase, YidC/Oxa1 family, C-terminal domain-containing protein n=1 Tax=Clostridium cavendishii DSM 21758 TaxID=1121302 RepID=A0A1M6QU98_9CLOT|nr:membrane protein insertase YidC [Clostridium cavendishii]SHK23831.1 membrane protein insertase, YidC/Oxa1 family, C-terminal domain-containing protein [Clostridium cavendishii DSM 21758]